jgi:hypothetical protein
MRGRGSWVATPTPAAIAVAREGIHIILSVAILCLHGRRREHGAIGALGRLQITS